MSNPLFIIAGPCVIENREMLRETACELKRIADIYGLKLIFKSSYRKANRTSDKSFTGIGDIEALSLLEEIKRDFSLPILTDIHIPEEAALAAKYADVLQIPAFLCRQTDLLHAAGKSGKTVNIKKGQFMAPEDMKSAVEKVAAAGASDIWLTERGTSFGYHDLIVDFRSLLIMKQIGCPIVFDATHSMQKPSLGEQSGGVPEFTLPIAQAAAAIGIDGLFFETHPDPKSALSDAATQLPLNKAESIISSVLKFHELSR